MTTESTTSNDIQPRDAAYWAQQATIFQVAKAPTGALNLNVNGHRALSPLQGFGQMWQKTFRVRLTGSSVKPSEVIKTWKDHFSEFWPKWDRFYKPLSGIAPPDGDQNRRSSLGSQSVVAGQKEVTGQKAIPRVACYKQLDRANLHCATAPCAARPHG